MPIDSDIASADDRLHVRFYNHSKDPDKFDPYVEIIIPGDKNSIIDQPAHEGYRKRFARHWLSFQAASGNIQAIGTPLELWNKERPDQITDGQLRELQILGFQTAEQVAMGSDSQMQRVGMGGLSLREKAKNYISSKNSEVASGELEKTKAELNELRDMIAAMKSAPAAAIPPAPAAPDSELAELRAMVAKLAEAQTAPAPKRRGPKPGYKRKAIVNDHDAPIGATGHE